MTDDPQSFAAARARLDEILEDLERDGNDVDELAKRVEEAARLLTFCRGRLDRAKVEVERVVAELNADEAARAAGHVPGAPSEPEQPEPAARKPARKATRKKAAEAPPADERPIGGDELPF